MSRTALRKYARLEAPGRYFDGEAARPRQVMLSFGERSLVIMGFDGVAIVHWPLASLRAVSDRGDRSLQIVPDLASDERLVIEEPMMIRAIEAVCPGLRRRPADRRGIGKALVYGSAGLAAVLALVLVIIPDLAGRLAPLVPPEQERRLGDAVVEQLRVVLGGFDESEAPQYCAEAEGLAALGKMRSRLEGATDLPYPLEVAVFDHQMVNAFAVPGGRVILFRGLIEDAAQPEEVAGVLAHEIGHVVHRDPMVGVLRSAGTAGILGLLVGDVFGVAVVIAGAEAIRNAQYQQEVEARADREAVAILSEAGLPSSPLGGFFQRMAARYGESAGVLRYLSSHPALGERARAAREADGIAGQAFEPVLTDAEWLALRQICAERVATRPR